MSTGVTNSVLRELLATAAELREAGLLPLADFAQIENLQEATPVADIGPAAPVGHR